jgi:murein DD-endopeptidase MepM/ murein hydrolase activator NlpD
MKLSKARPKQPSRGWWLWVLIGSLAWNLGCSAAPEATATPDSTPTAPPPTGTLTPSLTQPPTQTTTVEHRTPTLSPTNTIVVYSPLTEIAISDLPDTIHNPYKPPRLGSDDPHQGVDFYDLDPDSRIARAGRSVQAVLPGSIASVISDRFPFGNAILVETPLSQFTAEWVAALPIPDFGEPWESPYTLTCPPDGADTESQIASYSPSDKQTDLSLYLLYAHMKDPGNFQIGRVIQASQSLGLIGNSGNSLNPHLHLEARIGPGGMQFESLAHYDASATPIEMYNYCLWRVSGLFMSINPLNLFGISP